MRNSYVSDLQQLLEITIETFDSCILHKYNLNYVKF